MTSPGITRLLRVNRSNTSETSSGELEAFGSAEAAIEEHFFYAHQHLVERTRRLEKVASGFGLESLVTDEGADAPGEEGTLIVYGDLQDVIRLAAHFYKRGYQPFEVVLNSRVRGFGNAGAYESTAERLKREYAGEYEIISRVEVASFEVFGERAPALVTSGGGETPGWEAGDG